MVCSLRALVFSSVAISALLTSPTFRVGSGSFNMVGPYMCGKHGSKTLISYPEGDGPFHVVVYGHGIGGGIDDVQDWLETIAGLGLIVIAPWTTGGMCIPEFTDMIRALSESRMAHNSHLDLHPALRKADFSRTGIMGHSMGGFAATIVGSFPHMNISAMLASHGASITLTTSVPSMFVTGTSDKVVSPMIPFLAFKACPARPKIFANLVGGDHMEPRERKRMNLLTAKFLSCHVAQNQDHCAVIYGTGPGTLCFDNVYAGCFVERQHNTSDNNAEILLAMGGYNGSSIDQRTLLV